MNIIDRLLGRERSLTTDLDAYVQEVTGVEIGDVVTDEKGEVIQSSTGDLAYICLSLSEGGAETLSSRFSEAGMRPFTDEFKVPLHNGHELIQKLKSEEMENIYLLYRDGKGRKKTRSLELYITRDKEGNEYLYLFG